MLKHGVFDSGFSTQSKSIIEFINHTCFIN